MLNGLEDIAIWLTLGGALLNLGVTWGSLPRLSRDLDEDRKSNRAEFDALWRRDEQCTNDRRKLSERIAQGRHPEHA